MEKQPQHSTADFAGQQEQTAGSTNPDRPMAPFDHGNQPIARQNVSRRPKNRVESHNAAGRNRAPYPLSTNPKSNDGSSGGTGNHTMHTASRSVHVNATMQSPTVYGGPPSTVNNTGLKDRVSYPETGNNIPVTIENRDRHAGVQFNTSNVPENPPLHAEVQFNVPNTVERGNTMSTGRQCGMSDMMVFQGRSSE
jgi:hypothetical protein